LTPRATEGDGRFRAQRILLRLDRADGSFIEGGQYVSDLNWTKGLDPKTGKPIEYDPGLDVQKYVPEARALRGDPMKRTCPIWHGGVSYQPTSAEGCFSGNGAAAAFKGPDGGLDRSKSQKRTYISDLYYGAITAYDAVTSKVSGEDGDGYRSPFRRDGHRRGPGVLGAAGRLGGGL
jgi:alcohol dehydrogenase (cytochrome c)